MLQMSRRKFLKTGAKGIAFASIPVFFKANPVKAFLTPAGEEATVGDFMSHFGVDEKMILDIMGVALSKGGDYCDLYFQHSVDDRIGLEDGIVNRAYTNVDFGVGIRVIEGDQTGYSFTEQITPEAMRLAAKTAANIASESKNTPPVNLDPTSVPNYYPIETPWEQVRIDRKIPLLNAINDRIFSLDKRVIKASAYYFDNYTYMMVATSEGTISCDYQPMTYLYGSCTAEQNGQKETNSYAISAREGIDFLTREKTDKIADRAVAETVLLFDAVKPEGGEMPVVLGPGGSGILLHEAIGHGMEADFNRKDVSIFADKINKKVAEKFITIVDNGTNLHSRGSINVDDEGNPTEETHLVQDGILSTYLHDRISSNYYKIKSTGSGRRQSFRHTPMPRMRNTYMLPGPHTEEEIIKSVKKGIYAQRFTNGQVNIGPGDFTFYVKSGYLIEDGKITRPVKDINIIGNGPDVLSKITMLADNLKLDEGGWTCGKNGQRVPVSQGQPACLVSSITVGGVS